MEKQSTAETKSTESPVTSANPESEVPMSELMKSHLDEVAGGLASHGSWGSIL